MKLINNYYLAGFTIIEAMISMLIFTVAFSGLYFFFSGSQQSIISSDKNVALSLMADTIVETIAAEAKRSSSDSLNPFVSPGSYSANLSSCSFGFGDVRQTWCTDLVAVAGPYNAASGNEVRSVNVFVDGNGNLMVNVSLVAEGGNVTANSSRNIRP